MGGVSLHKEVSNDSELKMDQVLGEIRVRIDSRVYKMKEK